MHIFYEAVDLFKEMWCHDWPRKQNLYFISQPCTTQCLFCLRNKMQMQPKHIVTGKPVTLVLYQIIGINRIYYIRDAPMV